MSDLSTSEAIGEDQGTSVTVSRKVSHSAKEIWQALMTDEGAEALLGPGSHFGQKGYTWRAVDGRTGVIRSFHPLEEIRFSWRKEEYDKPSMVELKLVPEGDGTVIQVIHSNLTRFDRESLVAKWEAALDRIETECM